MARASSIQDGRDARGGVIRVLLADDQALIRAGFRVLLEADPELTWWAKRWTGGRR